ncbi:MAG: O-antigen ligase family protein [Candidatus Omnitrophota bacterium]
MEHNALSAKAQEFLRIAFYTLPLKEEAVKFFSIFSVFIIAMNVLEKKRQFQRIVLVIIFWGLLLSFYGLFKKYTVLGAVETQSFSTFGNANHFAGYMIMVVPLAIGYGLSCRNIFVKLIFGFIAAMISASIFLSLSRAGSFSLLLSLMVMCYLLFRQNADMAKYGVIILVVAVSMLLLAVAGPGPLKKTFIFLKEGLLGRWAISRDSLAITRDFPLCGCGLGNFSYIFPIYQTFATFPVYYKYLHNEYLQMIVEIGLIGALFYFFFIFKILKDIFGQITKRHDPFVQNIVLGGWCGLIGVLFHSIFEFNFHIPAVTFLFWLIMGLSYKCAYTRFLHPSSDNEEET